MEPKTIILDKNYQTKDLAKNEPMSQPRSHKMIMLEREQRIEEYHTKNKSEKLTAEQSETLKDMFDWKLKLMKPENFCYNLLSFEEINAGDIIQTGLHKVKKGDVYVDEKTFNGYDGVVKVAKNVTPAKAVQDSYIYFIVI